jgi:hypothetical protein
MELTAEQWALLDPHIFRNDKLTVCQLIRQFTEVGLAEALAIFCERYDQLRAWHPENFTDSHEAYWDGFES